MHRLKLMALALSCFVAASAHGQDEFYYSFTSGPEGDGFNWPTSQIAKQGTIGLNGAGFVTPNSPLTLYNFSGNPAYFNSNNLLTRPASLISRDAWWTNPRLANYTSNGTPVQSAGLTIQFQQADWGNTEVYEFGFDLAFASASHALPQWLDFQITDTLGNIGHGYLSFAGTAPDNQGYVRSNNSSFNTLGSIYGGKQARFRFSVEDLLGLIDTPPSEEELSGVGFYGIEWMDIRLNTGPNPLVTMGGTSQIAMDNFVINGAKVGALPPAPLYVAPNFPLPNTTTYRFDYADPNAEGYVDLDDEDLTAISITSGTPDQPFGANALTTSSTVVFNSEPGLDVLGHEMKHTAQNNAPGPDERVDVGSVTVTVDTQEGSLLDKFAVEIESRLNPGLTPETGLLESMQEAKVLIETLTEIQQAQHRASMQVIQNMGLSIPDEDVMVALSTDDTDPGFAYYQNYSLLDYIDLKESQGEAWNVGDQGSLLLPVLGDDQEIETYILTTWLITDESGTYVQSMAVPEPGTLAVLMMGGALLVGRRRRA